MPPLSPAFGRADLSNCEREQIHLAGGIQPHGLLLAVREPELAVIQASANAWDYPGLQAFRIGQPLAELPGDLDERIRPHLTHPLHEIPSAVRCRFGHPVEEFDCLFHRPPKGGLVLELERAGPTVDLSGEIDAALQAICTAASVQELCDETARIFKQIAGYDRAMVYRFDDDGHGEVFSERRNPDLESYLGQRYPATDIPQIARRLYERNRVRVLVDVADEPVPLTPRLSPLTGEDLDMSLCFLRAMSPIHIQYLKNMGVGATLVASLVVGDRLWGLVACHHYGPRSVFYEVRAVCELLAESVATRIAALESFAQAQAELTVRRLEQRIAEVVSRDGDWRTALFDGSQSLLHPVNAAGAALIFEDEIMTTGEVPGTQELREISAWLDSQESAPVLATASLGIDAPDFARLSPAVSGLVAAPISNSPGEYLLWFRPTQIRTVTWGGNPFKPFVIGDDPSDLSPRRSFAQWHQQVEGTSEPWASAELAAAKLMGVIVSDVILQFRSVRVLIAQDQLDNVRRRVQRSDQAVIIADPHGRIVLTNEAFEECLRAAHPHLQWIVDLAPLFCKPSEVREMLTNLLDLRRSFRGEFQLRTRLGDLRPLLIRGDPVISSQGRVLGFVILVTDLSEHNLAQAARRRLHEALVAEYRLPASENRVDSSYRQILSSVLGNAQLAALEITDGIDPARMPKMLESVRASLDRTAELLDQLASHEVDGGREKS